MHCFDLQITWCSFLMLHIVVDFFERIHGLPVLKFKKCEASAEPASWCLTTFFPLLWSTERATADCWESPAAPLLSRLLATQSYCATAVPSHPPSAQRGGSSRIRCGDATARVVKPGSGGLFETRQVYPISHLSLVNRKYPFAPTFHIVRLPTRLSYCRSAAFPFGHYER